MKTCYYDRESRAIADLDPYPGRLPDERAAMLLTRINVPTRSRGRGIARRLMEELLHDADEEGVWIYLEVVPSGGLSYDQLVAWYKRLGFRKFAFHSMTHFMCREPRAKSDIRGVSSTGPERTDQDEHVS